MKQRITETAATLTIEQSPLEDLLAAPYRPAWEQESQQPQKSNITFKQPEVDPMTERCGCGILKMRCHHYQWNGGEWMEKDWDDPYWKTEASRRF